MLHQSPRRRVTVRREEQLTLWEARISTIGPNQLRLSSTSVLRSRERTQDPSRAGRYRAEAARCFIVVSSISKQRSNHRTGGYLD